MILKIHCVIILRDRISLTQLLLSENTTSLGILTLCLTVSAKVVLITSVPGTFYTHKLFSYGHMKIRKIFEGITLPDRMRDAPLWCQFSSLGMLGEDWIYNEFLKSFTSNKYQSSSPLNKQKSIENSKKIQFVWPTGTRSLDLICYKTVDFVRGSIDGYGSGGSLCLNK